MLKVRGYCSRYDFILARCTGRTVLHLGCIGETDSGLEAKLESFAKNRALHSQIMAVTREIVGVDLSGSAVELLRHKLCIHNIVVGNVERLEDLKLVRTFEVVVCGDLIEHLDSPGRMLDGIWRLMSPASAIIYTPNAFGLLGNLRFTLSRFHEGGEHVAAYSKYTLANLLERHRLTITALHTCYDRPPRSRKQRLQFGVGIPYFKLFPERGGTLIVMAKRAN